MLVSQLCLALCNPVSCSLPGSSVLGILQERILEWVAIPASMGSSWTQRSNPGIPHCQIDSLPYEPRGKPKTSKEVFQIKWGHNDKEETQRALSLSLFVYRWKVMWPFGEKVPFYESEREVIPELTLLVSWFWASCFQNCEKTNLCCLSPRVYGILLWQPKQTDASTYELWYPYMVMLIVF